MPSESCSTCGYTADPDCEICAPLTAPTKPPEAVKVTQGDKATTAEILGFRDWDEATDYRNSGEMDRKVAATLAIVARHREEAEKRAAKRLIRFLVGQLDGRGDHIQENSDGD